MKRVDVVAVIALVVGLTALTGCEGASWRHDPLATDGRDGGGKALGYPALMRIGAAAHAGGDWATAVGLYRQAAAINPRAAAPFVAAGNTLTEMGEVNEAIISYNSALARSARDPEALRGLARAYLMTGKPELAGGPLAIAYQDTPDDPKLLQLIGVAGDFAGQHGEAQARYRRGLELLPGDPGLSLNLSLSLSLTGNYAEAIGILGPIATAETATPRDRQTLALILGIAGDDREAARLARFDLDASAVQRNLAYYESLRRLPADARARAIRALSIQQGSGRPS